MCPVRNVTYVSGRSLRKSIGWQSTLCSISTSIRIFGNIWEHLFLKKRHGLPLGDHAGVSVNLEGRRHIRMRELGLRNLQRCSLNMQKSETMPIDSWESCTLAGGLQTSPAQIVGRQRATVETNPPGDWLPEREYWALSASTTARERGTSLLLAWVFGEPNRPMKQVSATTKVSSMKFMRFHRNARISPILRPAIVAIKTMVRVGSLHATMRRFTSSAFRN